jgi:hypothetical protein
VQRKTFINTRARFQRLTDAKLFSGWVRHFGKNTLVVSLTRDGVVKAGDIFIFQVFGPGSVAMFEATVSLAKGQEITLAITNDVRLIRSSEEMRVLVEGMTGTLLYELREHEIMFVDVSDKGAGVLSPRSIPKDATVELHIDTSQGKVICTGEIRYCKLEPKIPGQYRIGMRLTPQNRIDIARWQKLMLLEAA